MQDDEQAQLDAEDGEEMDAKDEQQMHILPTRDRHGSKQKQQQKRVPSWRDTQLQAAKVGSRPECNRFPDIFGSGIPVSGHF
uniref:INCENP_ARK-bind domain-containing protein n=1 Tax=Globodera pallida TaxID=36090 RepID=A0A183BKC0_GLOPA